LLPNGAYQPETAVAPSTYETKAKSSSAHIPDSPQQGVDQPKSGPDTLHSGSSAKSPSGSIQGNPLGDAEPAIAASAEEMKAKSLSVVERAMDPAPVSDMSSHETGARLPFASTQGNPPVGGDHTTATSAPSPRASDTKANSPQVNLQDIMNQPGSYFDSSYPQTQTNFPPGNIAKPTKGTPPPEAVNTSTTPVTPNLHHENTQDAIPKQDIEQDNVKPSG
jgi:hypothetical protein